jgi:hypothetical protein
MLQMVPTIETGNFLLLVWSHIDIVLFKGHQILRVDGEAIPLYVFTHLFLP